MGDIITAILLAAALLSAVLYRLTHKGKGGCHGCTGCCSDCEQKKPED